MVCFSPVQRKLELECRLEEERMKIESEKTSLEKDNVSLQTKVKQLGQQSECEGVQLIDIVAEGVCVCVRVCMCV